MRALTPPTYRVSCTDNGWGAKGNHKALVVKGLLFKQSTFKRPPSFKGNPFKGFLAPQSSFCRVLLNWCYRFFSFFRNTKLKSTEKAPTPLSLFMVLSPRVTFLFNSLWRLSPCPEVLMHISTQNKWDARAGRQAHCKVIPLQYGFVAMLGTSSSFLNCVKCPRGAF